MTQIELVDDEYSFGRESLATLSSGDMRSKQVISFTIIWTCTRGMTGNQNATPLLVQKAGNKFFCKLKRDVARNFSIDCAQWGVLKFYWLYIRLWNWYFLPQ